MSLTKQDDGWYHYEEKQGDIKIRETEHGYEFKEKHAIQDLAGFETGGPSIGELMENAVIAYRDQKGAKQ